MKLEMSVAALMSTLALSFPSWSAPVYDNSTTDTLLTYVFSVGAYTEIGDDITLGGTDRTLTDASVQFFNVGSSTGTFDATLRFYNLAQNPLGSFQNVGLTIGGSDVLTVTFPSLNLTVPDQFIFTVSVSNVAAGLDLGLNAFEPPSVGQSDSGSIMLDDGTGLTASSTLTGEGNLYFVANARTPGPNGVPEPSVLVLVALAVVVGSAVTRRR
jgi:hypothetical protein